MEKQEILEPFERMLKDVFAPEVIRQIDAGNDWQDARDAVAASGFLEALLPEEKGGFGLGWDMACDLFQALGAHAVPMQVGEMMVLSTSEVDREAARGQLAVLYSAMIAGAANRLLDMTVSYAKDRMQFGKPIGRQQAVQQQLAVMAQETFAIRLAVELACSSGEPPDLLQAASAKAIASRYASSVASVAHAVHGAIGISAEYDLHLFTRRLHELRLAVGAERVWDMRIGETVLADDATALDWVRTHLHS